MPGQVASATTSDEIAEKEGKNMNSVQLIGRIVKDPELKKAGETEVVNFTLAVNRDYKDATGERPTDFINCVAWGHPAKFLNDYVRKGHRIAVVGELNVRSYVDSTEATRWVTEVRVDKVEALEAKSDDSNEEALRDQKNRRYQELIKEGKTPAQAKAKVVEEFTVGEELPF